MAEKEEAEEKTLPASEKKLRDARRKAQVSHSKDFISGFTFLVVLIYLLLSWSSIRDQIIEVMQVAASSSTRPFAEAVRHGGEVAVSAFLSITIPIVAIAIITVLLAGMAGTLGPVFAFDPITPKMEHINPAEGFKRLVSLKSLVEFAKNLFKLIVLGAALFLVMRGWLQNMFEIPVCGPHCIGLVMSAMLQSLGAIAAIAFIAVGFVDLLLQRALFLRDMRMTRTEHKREQKDLEGDPIIRSEQRRRRRSFRTLSGKLGLSKAVCVVVSPGGYAVALRYNPDDSPVPTVVAKAHAASAAGMVSRAKSAGIPIISDPALAERLHAEHANGDSIRREHFSDVAGIMVNLGLI